jgi:S1-C subfamily serine protease
LKNIEGNTQVVKSVDPELLGATLVPLSEKEKKQYGLKNGLVVKDVKRSGKFNEAGIPEDYIIVRINNQDVNSLADVNNIVKKTQNNSQDQALFQARSGVQGQGWTENPLLVGYLARRQSP